MSREKPRNQLQTIRQRTIALLGEGEMSARELSKALRIREKEVYEHLAHVARSVASHRRKFVIQPSQCLVCGYVFRDRKRFTRPGRCPCCKDSHVQEPTYRIL